MSAHHGHGTEVVTDPRNEATRRADTRRVVFVSFSRRLAGPAYHGQTSVTATPQRCMDGIDILPQRP